MSGSKNITKFLGESAEIWRISVRAAKSRRPVTSHGVPRSVFLRSAVSYFPASPIGFSERGRPAPKMLGKLGGGVPEKYGGYQGGVAKFRRPASYRGVPPRPVFVRRFRISHLTQFGVGKGASVAKNIRKSGTNPPKFGGSQGGLVEFRPPVTFRSVPWGPAAFLYAFGSFVFPTSPNWVLGMGCPAPKILGNLRGGDPKKVGVFLGGFAKFRRSVALRDVPLWSTVCIFAFGSFALPPRPIGRWGRGGTRKKY